MIAENWSLSDVMSFAEEYKINVDPEADWSEIQDAFVKYVINGK